jgi:hypothetical protein
MSYLRINVPKCSAFFELSYNIVDITKEEYRFYSEKVSLAWLVVLYSASPHGMTDAQPKYAFVILDSVSKHCE